MEWQAITYPSCSNESVSLANQLFQHVAGQIQLPVKEQVYGIKLSSTNGHYKACISLGCRLDDSAVSVYLNDTALSAMLGNLISLQSFKVLSQDLQLALLEAAISPLADTMQERLGLILTIERCNILSDSDTAAAGLLFDVQQVEGTVAWSIFVELENTLPPSAIEWIKNSSQRPQVKDCGWLPLLVHLELGHTSLPLSDVESLKFGDIILLDKYYLSDNQLCVNISNYFSCLAKIDGDDLTVQTQLDKTMEEKLTIDEGVNDAAGAEDQNDAKAPVSEQVPPQAPAQASVQASVDTANLPMDLVFIAGQLSITLQELQQIQPGYVFDLKKNSSEHIEIRINGSVIGSGELVEVGGRVGVRVLECK